MNSARIRRHPRVVDDLTELADFIAKDKPAAADRFLNAAEAAFERLSSAPMLGEACWFLPSGRSELRYWPVPGFEARLIFYRPTGNGIEILRVLHRARDIARILDRDSRRK